MRIQIINTFYPPWRGGAETYTKNLAENLVKRGHKIEVIAANPPLAPGTYLENDVAINRLKSIGMFYGVPIPPSLVHALMTTDADIIHANFPNPYNAALGAIVSKIRKIPAVLTWHNDLPAVTRFAGTLVKIHDDFLSALYLDEYATIITTSNPYAGGSKILKRYRGKTSLILNGVDCERFRPDVPTEGLKETLGLGDCKIALFVGALSKWHRYKGLDDLLNAFKLVDRRDLKLLVIGGGSLRPEYEALAEKLSVKGKVIFVGEVLDNDLPKYYAISDTLVLPSKNRFEGFGLTILEANASGIPAIASRVGGIPGILVDGENGILVPPNNPVALAKAVCRIIDNDTFRRKLGKMSREVALKHDWKKVAQETEALYFRVLRKLKS